MLLPFVLALGTLSPQLAANAEPTLSACAFAPAPPAWAGSCGRIDGEELRLTLAAEPAITTGKWREGPPPLAAWRGSSQEADGTTFPLELETYADGTGALRTEYGWFPVTGYAASATAVTFRIDAAHQISPNELDGRILDRAAALLASNDLWNRHDSRRCPATATTLSIYCAMERAESEVTGGFHHRRPAMELVRQVVDARTAGRAYHHRLMDYNNDPSTTLADVRSLFAEARARIGS